MIATRRIAVTIVVLCFHRLAVAFQPLSSWSQPLVRVPPLTVPSSASRLRMVNGDHNSGDNNKSVLSRIISPQIDDRGLPISDVMVASTIAPALEVFWVTLSQAPFPTWLKPVLDGSWQDRGSLLAPTLLHGTMLACCWLLGALVARAYEEEAIDPTVEGYGTVFWRIFQAGCFASGVLIFFTQIDLLLEFGRYVQLGESPENDFRLTTAAVEIINDIFFEIMTLVPVRIFLAISIARDK